MSSISKSVLFGHQSWKDKLLVFIESLLSDPAAKRSVQANEGILTQDTLSNPQTACPWVSPTVSCSVATFLFAPG